MIFTNLVQANLRTTTLGQVIEYYTQLDSTNEESWELIDEGVKPGTVIITDRQLSGKGRNGKKWQSKADRSLTFSVVIQPNNLSVNTMEFVEISSTGNGTGFGDLTLTRTYTGGVSNSGS